MYRLLCQPCESAKLYLAKWQMGTCFYPGRSICKRYLPGVVHIGNVQFALKKPKNPEKVPVNYLPLHKDPSQSTLQHLKWIMQKDQLGQDIFLIGPPGSFRRCLAMQYLELTQREAEYVSLSRDTTESDLKQRREINSGTSYYLNQSSVRAALEGRVLILDGIEKAERNVLPVLNNLLENREMQLDDGSFLVAAKRYDSLLQQHSKKDLDKLKLLRVSENFRVFALGVPVPRYPGNPLDPPLRSRFQSRDVPRSSYKDQLESLTGYITPNLPKEKLSNLVSFVYTLQSSDLMSLGMPDFPIENLKHILKIMDHLPRSSCQHLLNRLYPQQLFMGKEGQDAVNESLKIFFLDDALEKRLYRVTDVVKSDRLSNVCEVLVCQEGQQHATSLQLPCGGEGELGSRPLTQKDFVMTPYHSRILADLFQSHLVKDFCLIGPKGCGKSVIVHQFSRLLGYQIEPIVLYQDMTSRDLLQQRTTLPNGDTVWRPSPLVVAALKGHLAVLDGIHRINPGTLSVLQRLVVDREISLYDNTQLVRSDRYEILKKKSGLSDHEMAERNVFPIHPSFRIIGMAEPPVIASGQNQWLGPELLSLFLYHHVEPLSKEQEAEIIFTMVPDVPKDNMEKVLSMADMLRNSNNAMADTPLKWSPQQVPKDPCIGVRLLLTSISSSLSTRQLLRIAKSMGQSPSDDLYETLSRACLTEFLPALAKSAFETKMNEIGIIKTMSLPPTKTNHIDESSAGYVQIGDTKHEIYNAENKTKVPETIFYDNVQHLQVMEQMLKDFRLGEHLLLVGNQGVGKNKIVDKFLQLLNRPREYVQLHRDTTVQTLTLQPTVHNGVIVYEDSPLVQALKYGRVLVIDEADKAPINVTCVLKTLVESGEMVLGDGRRVLAAGILRHPLPQDVIETHKDFRVIVLANRPGFPFLGNDFFGAMGDIFSCHAISNPDRDSEMAMLKQYGPDVSQDVLNILVDAFSELRQMADEGQIAYPYSTREVVNMVKHLQAFPGDGLAQVVRNVFDFDSYHPDVQKLLVSTLRKHGIPVGVSLKDIRLAKEFPLPSPRLSDNWSLVDEEKVICDVDHRRMTIKDPIMVDCPTFDIDRHQSRSTGFTELLTEWTLPLYESSVTVDLAVGEGGSNGDWIHVATTNPIVIYSMQANQNSLLCMDLFALFPYNFFNRPPQIKIAALGGNFQGQLIFHEQQTNTMLLLNPNKKQLQQISLNSNTLSKKISQQFSLKKEKYNLVTDRAFENLLVVYPEKSSVVEVVQLDNATSHTISLPFIIDQIHLISQDLWILSENVTNMKYFLSSARDSSVPSILTPVDCQVTNDKHEHVIKKISTSALPQSVLEQLHDWFTPSTDDLRTIRLVAGHDLARLIISHHDDQKYPISLYSFPRNQKDNAAKPMTGSALETFPDPLCLPRIGQIVRVVPSSLVPLEVTEEYQQLSNYLEVVDIGERCVRYVPLPEDTKSYLTSKWNPKQVFFNALSNDVIVSLSPNGSIRLWETGTSELQESFKQWKTLVGDGNEAGPLQVTHERDSGLDVSSPKHGKIDRNNKPHVGGNTWAGGTGGRDTAGLGGKGGPYRLDAGHDVHQISQEEKDAVPEEVKRAAREMGQKAFKERLEEIQMSEYEADVYEKFSSRVHRQVQSLRVVIESMQAKGKERNWVRHQTSGDLDDSKLIEGLTGEKGIYKKRADQEPEPGSVQQLPKQLRLVVDVSGSMYRFNGLDGRLERIMEAACLVMESFDKYENKFKYDIVGHSGENSEILFVSQDAPPVNNKQRLQVLESMHAHAQFCMTGDHTLEATSRAIKEITKREADEYFVIIFSDANLRRYGIPPVAMANSLVSNPKVNAFIIFIGSLGNEAERLSNQLPTGRSFVCMDTKNIPKILQQIFASAMLSS